jgi:hypothetical protein
MPRSGPAVNVSRREPPEPPRRSTGNTRKRSGRTITLDEQHQAILAVIMRGISPAGG